MERREGKRGREMEKNESKERERKRVTQNSSYYVSSQTHSDERHFGLVTETVVSSLQFLRFLKNRQKEVNNLGWFESYNATKGSKMAQLSVPTHPLSNLPAWTFNL